MDRTLKLPVGIDNFEKIRKSGFYYIDKTRLIEQLLQNWGEVNLFTRPRRFGKTVMANMITAFLGKKQDSDSIFQSLKISQNNLYNKYRNQYNVISIDRRSFTRKEYLWPIKEYNLTVNKNLVQNYGW